MDVSRSVLRGLSTAQMLPHVEPRLIHYDVAARAAHPRRHPQVAQRLTQAGTEPPYICPRKMQFSRAGSSIQNRSIKFSRCVSVAHVTASDERCSKNAPGVPSELTITSPKHRTSPHRGRLSDPLENSAFRNSKK